jgi:hypothetical protein
MWRNLRVEGQATVRFLCVIRPVEISTDDAGSTLCMRSEIT